MICLNPLSTGKSVQTVEASATVLLQMVLIPYLHGSLFRPDVVGSIFNKIFVLIPYLQGSLFRHRAAKGRGRKSVLIPYLQGSLFRPTRLLLLHSVSCLNPLSTGKSVQTVVK